MMLYKELPILSPSPTALIYRCVLKRQDGVRLKGICAEKSDNYCRLLFLIVYLLYIIKHCFIILSFIVRAYIYFSFDKIGWWVWSWNPHCRSNNSPNAASVQLCEQRTVAVAVYLHLYFHSVHNSHNAVSVQLCEPHTLAVAVHLRLYFHSVHNSPNAVSV